MSESTSKSEPQSIVPETEMADESSQSVMNPNSLSQTPVDDAPALLSSHQDLLGSFSMFGTGTWLQGIEISKHFIKMPTPEETQLKKSSFANPHFTEHIPSDFQERKRLKEYNDALSALSWKAGFLYQNWSPPLLPTVQDKVYSLYLGLGIEISAFWEGQFIFEYDEIPNESYEHGGVFLSVEHTFFLQSNSQTDRSPSSQWSSRRAAAELDDAPYNYSEIRMYYAQLRKKKRALASVAENLENLAVQKPYPQFKLGWILDYNQHRVQPKVLRDSGATIGETQVLSQFMTGPFLKYFPSPQLKWTLGAGFYQYSLATIEPYISFFDTLSPIRLAHMGVTDRGFSINRLMSFPAITLDGLVNWKWNEVEEIGVCLTWVSFYSYEQSNSFSFNPFYQRDLGNHWVLGASYYGLFTDQNSYLSFALLKIILKI